MIGMYSEKSLLKRKKRIPFQEWCNKEFEIYSQEKLHKTHQNTSVVVAKTHLTFDVNVNTMWYVTTHSGSGEAHQNTYLLDNSCL